VLDALDVRFADLVARRGGPDAAVLAVPAALTSALRRRGHVCMDLARPPAAWFASSFGAEAPDAPEFSKGWKLSAGRFPTLGKPGDRAPLVLDGTRLYLHRLWTCQHDLAVRLAARAFAPPVPIPAAVAMALDAAFSGSSQAGQLAAARAVVARSLAVISGGPGTGKTTAAVRALGALRAGGPIRIALAAPTGKAVARIKESLAAAAIPVDDAASATLHRLLGIRPSTGRPAHDSANPLPYDLVITDEVSMVDLELMDALVRALAPETRLVLLGDRDQLASVEPGSVFSDICAGLEQAGGAGAEAVTVLRHNFRFGADSGIGRLAQAVNAGDASAAAKLLGGGLSDVAMRAPPPSRELGAAVRSRAKTSWRELLAADSAETALASLSAFRILCAHRVGPWGSARIAAELAPLRGGPRGAGSPVMVTANDASSGLYNGDTGVWWGGEAGMTAVFAADGGIRKLAAGRMPPNEAAWALTVHKSQGSEFDEVVLVLPDRDSPLLTRELIYTAITRARRRVEIWGAPEILAAALSRRIERSGGLPAALAAAAAGQGDEERRA
jgi:exodeoxyribonuclease V alpha subunit